MNRGLGMSPRWAPDEDLVVGAQAVGDARVLRLAEEGLLGHGAGRGSWRRPRRSRGAGPGGGSISQGGEEAHHHVLLGIGPGSPPWRG